jgi:hypothetical protein
MFSRPERLIIALMAALVFAGVTLIAADASSQLSHPPTEGEVGCETCHADFMEDWQNGPHGQATVDPVFNEAWEAQGKPGACLVCHTTGYYPATGTWEEDGIACEACHGPIPADHPTNPASVNRSPVLCGSCHSDARFGWENWEGSSHYQRDMTCINCHDPHQATLKTIVPEGSTADNASVMCQNCHSEYSQDHIHTIHGQSGVSCRDCHLTTMEIESTPHTVQDHSFHATLAACNSCHAEEIHGDESIAAPAHPEVEFSSVVVTPEPVPVSPFGFAGLAALIGLAAGTVLAPWLEEKYRELAKKVSVDNE